MIQFVIFIITVVVIRYISERFGCDYFLNLYGSTMQSYLVVLLSSPSFSLFLLVLNIPFPSIHFRNIHRFSSPDWFDRRFSANDFHHLQKPSSTLLHFQHYFSLIFLILPACSFKCLQRRQFSSSSQTYSDLLFFD